jgi:hypothetical protein
VLVRFDHLTSGIVNANRTICQTIPRARAYGRLFTVFSTVGQNFAAKQCNSAQRSANPKGLRNLASATLRDAVKIPAKTLS